MKLLSKGAIKKTLESEQSQDRNKEKQMVYYVHAKNPQKKIMNDVAKHIQKGGVYIVPTDTVYAFVTTIENKKSIEKVYRLKNIPPNKPLSLYCRDFSQASEFVRMEDNRIFRWMKANLPGPFTLVFPASRSMPQYTLTKQKTVGIRIVDHPVIKELLDRLHIPLIGSSVLTEEAYITNPDDLEELYDSQVDGILNCGIVIEVLSTVLDATHFPPTLLRQGKGIYS